MRFAVILLTLWLAATPAAAQQPVPPLNQRVTDLTGTLSETERAEIASRLTQLEQEKGSQIAVLLVPTTAPEAIEQYALRVAEAWRLGREDVDDGVLLLVAKDDRKLRIEVGYGLEGAIPDAVARRVIADTITPYFKRGDFAGGIRAGGEQLAALIDGEPLPEPGWRQDDGGAPFPALMPLAFLLFPFGPVLSRYLGRVPGALLTGALMGGIGYLAIGLLVGVLFGAFGFIVALNARSGLGGGARPRRRRLPGDLGGGIYTGGGGFGGGGFGGGGGGFGGGGASGRW